MRRGRPDAGIEAPRPLGRRLLALLVQVAILAVFGFFFALPWIPDGIPWEGARLHEGLLHVPDAGVGDANWTSAALLRKNASAPAGAPQKAERVCIEVPAAVQRALRGVPRGRFGGKSIWVGAVAERRLGKWPCLQRRGARRGQIGDMLRIHRIVALKPLGCDATLFIVNDLRCPPPPPPPAPVRLDDQAGDYYPAAARRAGAEGVTTVRMLVGAGRGVLSCEVVTSSGNRDLDDGTCALLRRRPDLVAKHGRTDGLAKGVREVVQPIRWQLD